MKMTVFTMIFVITECIHFPSGLKSERLYALYMCTHLRTSSLLRYLTTAFMTSAPCVSLTDSRVSL